MATHELGIGAYTGVPLHYSDGRLYGTLCTLDPQGREIQPSGLALLSLAGRVVIQAVEADERRERERARDAERLRRQALHDSLTGLGNRTFLQEYLTELIASAQSHGGRFALLLVDLADLKEVNDAFGYQAGDHVLQETARRLERALPSSASVARLGGDEFAVVLPGHHLPGAMRVGDEIVSAIRQPFRVAEQHVTIGAAIGIVLHPEHGDDPLTLLHRVGTAMYRAQEDPAHSIVYEAGQGDRTRRRVALISGLHEAIRSEQLQLHYQPQVEIATERIAGTEALIRWQHPALGMIPPGDFIPLIERTDLITAVTTWVVREAVRQSKRWQAAGLRLTVAVNLSARSLHGPEIVDIIGDVLAQESAEPSCLSVEITEGAMMEDLHHTLETLGRLRSMGISIAVDDFGTGYSSLAYLARLPLTQLKIDRSFIKDLSGNESQRRIVRGTITLCHEFDLRVVAEGVEDGQAMGVLEDLGCDLVQGFFLARPLPEDECMQWLCSRATALAGSMTPEGGHHRSSAPALSRLTRSVATSEAGR